MTRMMTPDERAQADAEAHAAGKAVGYYVTAKNGKRVAWLLGPYGKHEEALANLDRVNAYTSETFAHRGSGFWKYGTSRLVMKPGRSLRAGALNAVLGLHEMTTKRA